MGHHFAGCPRNFGEHAYFEYPSEYCEVLQLTGVNVQAVAFVSSAYSGGVEEILIEFEQPQIIGILGISLFVLGFALGPLIWAPMSGTLLLSIVP